MTFSIVSRANNKRNVPQSDLLPGGSSCSPSSSSSRTTAVFIQHLHWQSPLLHRTRGHSLLSSDQAVGVVLWLLLHSRPRRLSSGYARPLSGHWPPPQPCSVRVNSTAPPGTGRLGQEEAVGQTRAETHLSIFSGCAARHSLCSGAGRE